ncbi:MAG TPA: putative ABC exporter domain-containing protein [Fimbriimonadaceae bacterium]|nr:putative ABC exporter domain-containing protein [Fimbriimonadaceae bacterium]
MALRPLLFLTYRCLANGLKRSLTSPKRLLTTLAIISYYFWWFVRPLMVTNAGFARYEGSRSAFPPLQVLDAVVFTAFAALSLILTLGLFGYRLAFKPADVDVLFPTPVNPKIVLLFRIVRDYFGTLLIPLFLTVMAWKPLQVENYFHDIPHPQSTAYAVRALTIGYVLITATWVSMGYALSLYVNRNDARSEFRKRLVGWSIAVACVIVVAVTIRTAIGFETMGDFVRYVQQPWLRAFFFTATPATRIVMGPLDGNFGEMTLGIVSLIGFSAACLYLALRQADWMYDQAAVRGFGAESMRQLQRKGDYMALMAESARRGKIKARKPGWFQRLQWRGFWALIWKDALIQWRSVRGMIILFVVVGLAMVVMPRFAEDSPHRAMGYIILVMMGFDAFMVATLTSQSGFTELLRRVDLQKPLPFGSQAIVMSEVLSKALPSMVVPVLCGLVGVVLFPYAWPEVLAGAIFFPSLGAVIAALVCCIVLLFPEIDDVSQRGFRGLIMLLGLFMAGAPGVGLFILITVLTKSAVLGSIPGAVLCYGVALGLSAIGGGLYANFNPTE